MKQLLLLSALVLIFTACSSGRRTHERMMEKAPEWVVQTPTQPLYYHGVGMAAKNPQFDFRERARQIALSELAAGISVNISSSSVLNMFEFDNVSSEFFLDNINMSVQQYLEGYELVEQWESNQQYWVYYRLSKAKYQQVKQERIDKALTLSKSKFDQARSFSLQGKTSDALGFYVKAFEDIKDFIAEDLTTSINGQSQPYATVLMTNITTEIRDMKVIFPTEKLSLKTGRESPAATIEATLQNSQGEPLAGIPVVLKYSWLPGRKTEMITDALGRFRFTPEGIKPGMANEEISCMVNVDRLVRQNTSDIFVHRFFEAVKPNSFSLPVDVVAPVFFIATEAPDQQRFDARQSHDSGIADEIKRILREEGLVITEEKHLADYTMVFKSQHNSPRQHGNRYSVAVNASVEIMDKSNRILFQTSLNDITGLGPSPVQAIEDANKSLRGRFGIDVIDRMMQTLF
ncbi:MAG: LPP20 family lipoprotein [Bacteroidota bacterium]